MSAAKFHHNNITFMEKDGTNIVLVHLVCGTTKSVMVKNEKGQEQYIQKWVDIIRPQTKEKTV